MGISSKQIACSVPSMPSTSPDDASHQPSVSGVSDVIANPDVLSTEGFKVVAAPTGRPSQMASNEVATLEAPNIISEDAILSHIEFHIGAASGCASAQSLAAGPAELQAPEITATPKLSIPDGSTVAVAEECNREAGAPSDSWHVHSTAMPIRCGDPEKKYVDSETAVQTNLEQNPMLALLYTEGRLLAANLEEGSDQTCDGVDRLRAETMQRFGDEEAAVRETSRSRSGGEQAAEVNRWCEEDVDWKSAASSEKEGDGDHPDEDIQESMVGQADAVEVKSERSRNVGERHEGNSDQSSSEGNDVCQHDLKRKAKGHHVDSSKQCAVQKRPRNALDVQAETPRNVFNGCDEGDQSNECSSDHSTSEGNDTSRHIRKRKAKRQYSESSEERSTRKHAKRRVRKDAKRRLREIILKKERMRDEGVRQEDAARRLASAHCAPNITPGVMVEACCPVIMSTDESHDSVHQKQLQPGVPMMLVGPGNLFHDRVKVRIFDGAEGWVNVSSVRELEGPKNWGDSRMHGLPPLTGVMGMHGMPTAVGMGRLGYMPPKDRIQMRMQAASLGRTMQDNQAKWNRRSRTPGAHWKVCNQVSDDQRDLSISDGEPCQKSSSCSQRQLSRWQRSNDEQGRKSSSTSSTLDRKEKDRKKRKTNRKTNKERKKKKKKNKKKKQKRSMAKSTSQKEKRKRKKAMRNEKAKLKDKKRKKKTSEKRASSRSEDSSHSSPSQGTSACSSQSSASS